MLCCCSSGCVGGLTSQRSARVHAGAALFAGMVNAERDLGCRLTVIPMAGWRRELMFPDLGYPFLMPSPSIPHFSNALLYAGTCLFEGTNVSEGRGTADPFALIGAPFFIQLLRQTRGWDS